MMSYYMETAKLRSIKRNIERNAKNIIMRIKNMTIEESLQLMDKMHQEELEVAKTKGKEYVINNDRLDNFTRIGRELNISPKKVLWVYLQKHLDSIKHYIDKERILSESIESRIMDARVYLFLLRGLIEDERRIKSVDSNVQPSY